MSTTSIESKNYYFYELWFEARAHAMSMDKCKCFDCAIFYFVKSEYLPLRQIESNSCIRQISLLVEGAAHSHTVPFTGEVTYEKILRLVDIFLKGNGRLGHEWNALFLHETFARLTNRLNNTQSFETIHSLDFLAEFVISCEGVLSSAGLDKYWPEYRDLIIKSLFDSEGNERLPFMLSLSAQELELKKIDDFSIQAQVAASQNARLAEEFNRSEKAAAEAALILIAQYEIKFGSQLSKANDVEKRKIGIHRALAGHVSRVPAIELTEGIFKLFIMEDFDAWIPQPWVVQLKNMGIGIGI